MRSLVDCLAICAIFVWVPALGKPVKNSEWIELSYPFNNETIYWPTAMSFHHSLVFENFTADGYYYASYDISASEHGGTHIDAPRHFAAGKWTTDQIPLDHLIGPAIKIDLSTKADENADYEMTPSDLQEWEEKHGVIPDNVILLVFFGWGKYWPNKKTYLGTDLKNTSLLHFPGIHPNASRWLVKNRKVKMVGIDTPSMDFGQSKMFQTHQILYAENIPGLENVAHMDKLPTKCFTVYAAPMFISGGSGGPCRVFARLDENCSTSAVVRFQNDIVFLAVMICLVFGFL